VPPEPEPDPEPTEVIDLYDYDRACLTDQDRAWVDIGWEPPGESWSENGNPQPDPERFVWAAAQADYLHLHAVLSSDVLPGDRCGACGGVLSVRPGVVDVQVRLSTLAGRDEHPAIIPGLGDTLPELARQIAFDPHTRPSWRWSVFDDDGELLHHGITTQRPSSRSPTGTTAPGVGSCTCVRVEQRQRHGTVELQLTLTDLAEPAPPGWQPVLADITAQVAADTIANPPGKYQRTGPDGRLLHHGHTARMPDATEAAFIRARDRSCRAPHCPAIARRCDLDHRIEHATGGPSHRGCVECRCPRHHHARDRHGWRITKTGHTTTWTLPNGRSFQVDHDKDLILTRD
jgi:hypothetical protein